MTTRSCAGCACRKTIQGAWYLIPSAAVVRGGAGQQPVSLFLCESCFRARETTQDASSIPIGDGLLPLLPHAAQSLEHP